MLLTKQDRPVDDQEWQRFLGENDFGQLIVPSPDGRLPVVTPTHFVFADEPRRQVELHLHRQNPAWAALRDSPIAMLSVIGATVYIPTYWNAGADEPSDGVAPTSYYAAVQVSGAAVVIEEPDELAALLLRQLHQHQPEGRHGELRPDGPYWHLLRAIRGLRIDVENVVVKFKFGGNRDDATRKIIAERLLNRGRPSDLAARELVLRRVAPELMSGCVEIAPSSDGS